MQDFMIHTWSATLRTITLEVNGTLFIPRQHQNNPEENQFRVTIFASDVFFATYPNILNSMSVGRTQMNWNISFRDEESYCVIVDQVTLRTCRSLFLHGKKFLGCRTTTATWALFTRKGSRPACNKEIFCTIKMFVVVEIYLIWWSEYVWVGLVYKYFYKLPLTVFHTISFPCTHRDTLCTLKSSIWIPWGKQCLYDGRSGDWFSEKIPNAFPVHK